MSAYKTIQCSLKDKNILIESLKNIGWEPVCYKASKPLQGFEGDSRPQRAEIVVPKSQISTSSNDLGFSYDSQNKEYLMLCSLYDLHTGVGDKVQQSYATTAIKKALEKNKFNIKTETKDKKIIIKAEKII